MMVHHHLQYVHNNKRFVFVCVLALIMGCLPRTSFAQDFYTASGISVLHRSATGLTIQYTPQMQGFDTVRSETTLFIVPRIKGATLSARKAGMRYAQQIVIPIVIPHADGCIVESVEARSVRRITGAVLPKPQLRISAEGLATPQYKSEQIPNDDSDHQSSWATLRYSGISRNNHIAHLTIHASRPDDSRTIIEIPKTITVTLSFRFQEPFQAPATTTVRTTEQPIALVLNREQLDIWKIQPEMEQPKGNGLIQRLLNKQTPSILAVDRWLKVLVQEEGVQRITAQELASKGITLSAQDVATIRVWGRGGRELSEKVSDAAANAPVELPLLLDTSSDGRLNALYFYAQVGAGWSFESRQVRHFINHYSYRGMEKGKRSTSYMLSVGGTRGLRATMAEPLQGFPTLRPQSYTARHFWEEEKINPYKGGSGRRNFGQSFISGVAQTLTTVSLPNLAQEGSILYRIAAGIHNKEGRYQGGTLTVTETATTPATAITTLSLGSTYSDYTTAYVSTQTGSIAASALKDRSTLQFLFRGNQSGDDGVVDWIEIHYPRAFVPMPDNTIEFFSESLQTNKELAEYTINGFTASGTLYALDVTNPLRPQFLRNISSAPTTQVVFRAEVEAGSPKRFFATGTVLTPTLETTSYSDLRLNPANAEYVVVTHKDLLNSAKQYQTYRQQQGMSVALVTTEELYNEFAAGNPDPTAIRDYLVYAYKNWKTKPRYVLFWGDGHYDSRLLFTTQTNYVPTYQSLEADGTFDAVDITVMTEDYFAKIVGDDRLTDIALGRLPAKINDKGEDEGLTLLNKIKRYEMVSSNDTWRSRVLLVADDGATSYGNDGTRHTYQSEEVSQLLPSDIVRQKIYLPEFPSEFDGGSRTGGRKRPAANQAIISGMNTGAVIVNWIGHGNPYLWAHEQIFSNTTSIPQLTNLDKLFFLTAATCDYSRFDDPEAQCGSELLLSAPNGGAIGVLAATRTVYSDQNAALNGRFYQALFMFQNDGYTARVGEVLQAVKQVSVDDFTYHNDSKYCLLGDPVIKLHIPQHRVQITHLNGVDVKGTLQEPQIKALSNVDIRGQILALDRSSRESSFNGQIVLSLYDSDIVKNTPESYNNTTFDHIYAVQGGLLNFGAAKVTNGQFTAKIIVPQDISFSNLAGRLFGYASDTNGVDRFARGITTQFTVGGTNTDIINDGAGPEISIALDNRFFRAGDFVQPKPVLLVDLFDQTGLNTSGSGIGHDIQYWLDDNIMPVTMTPNFISSVDDSRRGSVQQQLPLLTPGIHRIRVRAWDVFNNYSEKETWFRVNSEGAAPLVTDTFSYPNPFSETTTIRFRHNNIAQTKVFLAIYSIYGNLVFFSENTSDARTVEIPWNGLDQQGKPVATGLYVYRISVRTESGDNAEGYGKILVNR